MKRLFLFSCSLVCSLAHATAADDLRHAIINSDIEQVLELLPSFSQQDKNSFIPLAQEILTKRAHDYEAYRLIPQISLPAVAACATGLATYRHYKSKEFSYTLQGILIKVKQFFLSSLSQLAKDQNFKDKLMQVGIELNLPSDFPLLYKEVEKEELRLGIYHTLNKLGVAAGLGLVATSVWLLFHNQQQLHDSYMNALEIKYLLTDTQETAVRV